MIELRYRRRHGSQKMQLIREVRGRGRAPLRIRTTWIAICFENFRGASHTDARIAVIPTLPVIILMASIAIETITLKKPDWISESELDFRQRCFDRGIQGYHTFGDALVPFPDEAFIEANTVYSVRSAFHVRTARFTFIRFCEGRRCSKHGRLTWLE